MLGMLRIRRMREYLHSGMADYIYDTVAGIEELFIHNV